MRIELLLFGAAMGLAFAAPPGAVTAETLRRGLPGGFRLALSVQAGSLIGDACYALLALAGAAAFLQARPAQVVVGGLGVLFLFYLAWQSLRPATDPRVEGELDGSWRKAFLSGMLLSLTNPWAIAFWVSLGGSFLALGLDPTGDLPWVFASFMFGTVTWGFVLAALIERGRRWLSPALFRAASLACGVLLALFALGAAARLVSTFMT